MLIDKDRNENVCANGSNAVHAGGRENSRMLLTMKKGDIMNVPKKLDLVATSSTETEASSDEEIFPKCGWFEFFSLAQGNGAKEDTIKKDSTSFNLFHKHHIISVGKEMKFVIIINFFVV